jgi:hypothetical protein
MLRVVRAVPRAAVSENGLYVSYAPTPSGNQGGTVADIDPFASATELLAAFRAGRVTSRDLTELYIRRIERGVLLGLPITLKESFNVAGLETPCGVPEWKGYDR